MFPEILEGDDVIEFLEDLFLHFLINLLILNIMHGFFKLNLKMLEKTLDSSDPETV